MKEVVENHQNVVRTDDRVLKCVFVGWSRTASVTTDRALAVNGSAVVNSRPMAGPPGPSPQRSTQSFNRPPADLVDRLTCNFINHVYSYFNSLHEDHCGYRMVTVTNQT